MRYKDYWVDGHYIAARTPDEARAVASDLYEQQAQSVRAWTDADQAEYEESRVWEAFV